MKARIVRIGNSQGIRIPKPLLEQAGLGEEVELRVEGSRLVIESAARPRAGWAAAFAAMHSTGDDVLLDEAAPTDFDRDEWVWKRR
ncbi:MAG: AbrB/MazE/SpoVT family DNA-binding domain-containing protein [Gemmatimonadaceae bacterium]